MRAIVWGLLALCGIVVVQVVAAAKPPPQVTLLDTFPPGRDIVVAPNQNIYLRIGYDTDSPVHVWPRPYFRGEKVDAGSSPSRVYSGSGELLGWFFLMEPGGEVDEIRVTAGDGSRSGTPEVARWPLRVQARSGAAVGADEPAWVKTMLAESAAAELRDYEARMAEPVSAGEATLLAGFMWAVLALGVAGIAWPLWALWKWRGRWRIAAAVPAVAVMWVVMRIVVGGAIDPTSHNLWPFEIVQVGGLSVVAMVALALSRKLVRLPTP